MVTTRYILILDTLEFADILIINQNPQPIRRRKMLAAIAAIALIIGGVSAGVAVSNDDQASVAQSQATVIMVQKVETQTPVFGS
jgi:hypothetical protein